MNKEQRIIQDIDRARHGNHVVQHIIEYLPYKETEMKTIQISYFIIVRDNKIYTFVHIIDLLTVIFDAATAHAIYEKLPNGNHNFHSFNLFLEKNFFEKDFFKLLKEKDERINHFKKQGGEKIFWETSDYIDETQCFIDDFFLDPNPDMGYLKKILSNTEQGSFGLWERLVSEKYKDFMVNTTTRQIHHTINHGLKPELSHRMIFIMMLSEEPSVQRLVRMQLIRAQNFNTLQYLDSYFIPFLKVAVELMLSFSFYHNNIQELFGLTLGRVHFAWSSKSISTCSITIDNYKQLQEKLASDARTKKAKKVEKKVAADRAQRRQKKPTRKGRRGRV